MTDNWPSGFDENGAELWDDEFAYSDGSIRLDDFPRSATISCTLTPEGAAFIRQLFWGD